MTSRGENHPPRTHIRTHHPAGPSVTRVNTGGYVSENVPSTGPNRTDSPVPRLALSIADAAVALGLSDRTVDELARAGELPSIRVGRRRLFVVRDLERWLDELAQRN